MELNQIDEYKNLIDQFFSLFNEIKEIFSINLNDSLKSNNYQKMISHQFIIDINKILQLNFFNENNNNTITSQLTSENNLFIKYSLEYEKIIANNLIINKEDENSSETIEGHFSKNITKNKIFKIKKEHEIKRLSEFINKALTKDTEALFEFGCGKSYLTDALLSTENNNLIYCLLIKYS